MNIKDVIYMAYNIEDGEIYRTYNGKNMFQSLGPLRTSIMQKIGDIDEEVLRKFKIAIVGLNINDLDGVTLWDLKNQTQAIRDLQEEERKIKNKLKTIKEEIK